MTSTQMEINIWKGDWGIPSVDFHCLQMLALAKISGADVKVNKTNNPFRTPKGYLPVFRHFKQTITKLQDMRTYLKEKNFCPDVDLTNKQLAEIVAYDNMLQESLYPALVYVLWIDEKNYLDVTRPWYAKALPFPLNFYYPGFYKKEYERNIDSLHPDLDKRAVVTQVYKEAEKCLTCLSSRLGEQEFFFGKYPTTLDAIVYGYLAPLLKIPFPSNVLQNHLKASPNLVKFITRLTQRYFPQDVKEFENSKQKESKENKKEDNDPKFPNKIRNQILAGIFVTVAMLGYGFLMGIFSVSMSNTKAIEHNIHMTDEDEESQ